MAGTKISALTAAAALGGTEAIPGVQSAANVKITAAQIKTYALGAASALSAPAVPVTGAWITGGSATTTKPHALIEPAGTTSTGWSTGGTGIGVNAASGFTGNLIDAQLNGVSKFYVDATGSAAFLNSVNFSSANLLRAGGLYFRATIDTILTSPAAATLQHGAADAASPVAQTIKFQDVAAGTSNTAGVNATIQAPAGTGTGAGGSLIFQVAPAGSSGSAKNAWVSALTLYSSGNAAFTGSITATSDISTDTNVNIRHTGPAGVILDSTGDGVLKVKNWASSLDFTITAGASNLATFSGGITAAGTVNANAFVVTAGSVFAFSSRLQMQSPSDGVIGFYNSTASSFSRMQFGGTTSSFPALKRSTTTLQARLADDSAFTAIQGKLTTDTAYTAGAPTATGYLLVYDSTGTAYRVPALLN